jgi:hypothetical protein
MSDLLPIIKSCFGNPEATLGCRSEMTAGLILIITCHPERYRGLKGPQFIDLEELVRAAA